MTGEDSLFSESELTETLRNDIETWIDGSRLSVINSTIDRTKDRSESLNVVNAFDSGTAHSEEIQLGQFVSKIKSRSVGDNLDSLTKSDASSFKSLSESIDDRILDSDDIQVKQIFLFYYLFFFQFFLSRKLTLVTFYTTIYP